MAGEVPQHLVLGELPVTGALGAHTLVRRVRERVGAHLEDLLDDLQALRARQLDADRDEIGIELAQHPVVRVHEHESVHSVGFTERHDLGDHAAHRVAQQIEADQPSTPARARMSSANSSRP